MANITPDATITAIQKNAHMILQHRSQAVRREQQDVLLHMLRSGRVLLSDALQGTGRQQPGRQASEVAQAHAQMHQHMHQSSSNAVLLHILQSSTSA